MKSHIYSVSQINRYIKNLIEKDIFLRDVFIEAEISNFKAHTSGHFYFTLKDEFAAINSVMYKSYSRDIKFLPENGMKVTVYGYISIYEKTGQYQLCVKIMEPTGKGALYAAFEQLKNKLEKEGLFDIGRKRRIPKFPRKIAVLTSPVGAAIRDIIRISERRNPNIKIVVVPVVVQGETAAKSICEGLDRINRYKNADVIILGRGGGSIEDLWCFNDELVARAVFKSKIPVISAVGHETDFTISDFVADFRASTPSAAAEIAVPSLYDIRDNVYALYDELNYCFEMKKFNYESKLKNLTSSYFFKKPLDRISDMRKQIFDCQKNIDKVLSLKRERMGSNLDNLVNRLEGISPLNVVKRGFSIAYKDNVPISSINSVSENDIIQIRLRDGYLKSKIVEKGEFDAKEKNI